VACFAIDLLSCNSNKKSETTASATETDTTKPPGSKQPPVAATIVVPDNARVAFEAKYPGAVNVVWAKEGAVNPDSVAYQVNFTLNGVDYTSWYDANGKLIASSVKLENSKVPVAVSTAIAKDNPGFMVVEVDEVTDNNNKKTYEADLQKGSEKKKVHYSSSGKQINK
jgi:hypothetical protein